MTRHFKTIILFTLTCLSCGQNHFKYARIAESVCAEVGADHCKFYWFNDSKKFIEFKIYGCPLLNKERTNRMAIASYVATQVFKRLDKTTLEDNSGINIIFDSLDDIHKDKECYYEMGELSNAWIAFDAVEKYINAIRSGDLQVATSLMDTNYFELNVQKINSDVKNRVEKQFISSSNMFGYFDYPGKSGQTVKCLTVATSIRHGDKSFSQIDFLVLNTPTEKRIINVKVQP